MLTASLTEQSKLTGMRAPDFDLVLLVDPRSSQHPGLSHGPCGKLRGPRLAAHDREESVHDLLDTLKQCVESNAATYFRFRITYEN